MDTVDIHTHLIPPMDDEVLSIVGLRLVDGRVHGARGPIGPPEIVQPARLRAWMDDAGVSIALVSVPPPLYRQQLPLETSRIWVRALNDALATMLASEGRLRMLGFLPLEHPQLAVEEARRLADAGTVAGFTGAAGGSSSRLDGIELGELWELLEARDLPIVLHPASSADARLSRHYLENLLGNPVETGVALAELLFGGVLVRHPRLRVAAVHCGGVLSSVAGRWRRGVTTRRPGVDIDAADLEAGLRALWVDTLAHDPGMLRHTAALVGHDHVLLGSDWPFPMGSSDPLGDVRAADALLATRLHRNARAFLRSQNPDDDASGTLPTHPTSRHRATIGPKEIDDA